LRYRLLPYIYSLAGAAYHHNYTIMRGLVMDFNDDAKARSVTDQYMFGPSLLVNPVYEFKVTSRDVYLPNTNGWYDFHTGQYYKGGQTVKADAPLDKMPLFVKEGSIIPAGPQIQYTSQKPADPITLYVFTGSNAHFELYEDESVNYNYEKGQYATIAFDYDASAHTLTIGARKGTYKNMPEARDFEIVLVKKDHPVGVSLTAHADQVVKYTGQQQIVKDND
jgi:alpha-D-xyloside xylohydrolase